MADALNMDSISLALPGGDSFEDVTEVFTDAAAGEFSTCYVHRTKTKTFAQDMEPGRLILTEDFTLFDAMSAFEVC